MIKNSSNLLRPRSLFVISRKFFQMMTPEEYYVNHRLSSIKTMLESAKLKPLPEASNNPLLISK